MNESEHVISKINREQTDFVQEESIACATSDPLFPSSPAHSPNLRDVFSHHTDSIDSLDTHDDEFAIQASSTNLTPAFLSECSIDNHPSNYPSGKTESTLIPATHEKCKEDSHSSSASVRTSDIVRFVDPDTKENGRFLVVSRAGKAQGQYHNWFHVKNLDNGILKSVNFSQVEWSKAEEEVYYNASNSVEVTHAQAEELAKWKQYGVCIEVEDTGQPAITTRWVLTEKSVEGVRMVKARLVVRGYEEEASNIRTDSPTVCKENLRLVSTIAVSNKWKIHSMDVKSAFLQGFPIERVVHVIPPPEAITSNLWELRRTVYGLNDASRSWYLKAWHEIKRKGAVKSTFDNALFFWHPHKKLEGLICFHVDDFFFAGSQQFHNTVINHLRAQFQ